MTFGVLKDIKIGENRVICTPVEIASIAAAGHTVLVEKDAGIGSGFSNDAYAKAGAEIVDTAAEMWSRCDFLAKVKEIEPSEYGYQSRSAADPWQQVRQSSRRRRRSPAPHFIVRISSHQ